jgi:hypothetical protein
MAIKTGTLTTFAAKGIREDLSDTIYRISPEDTPFISNIGKTEANATFTEWQTDALDAPDTTNAQLEGDDTDSVGYQTVTPTVRLGNYCQISRKSVVVSGTHEKVNKAGRKKEMAYQLAKRSAELKRDMEAIALANQAAVAGNATTARKTASFTTFLVTNTDLGASGANVTYTTTPLAARTDGTARAFTEAILKGVAQKVWAAGGDPKLLMVGPVNKMKASAFTGIAQIRHEVGGAKAAQIIGAADVYVSDFGNISIVPNRFQRERDGLVVDPQYASIAYLRPFQTVDLAQTGDAQKKLLLVEWALRVHAEGAHGIAADLLTS